MSNRPFGQPTYYDRPRCRSAVASSRRDPDIAAEVRCEFINELDHPITVVLRNGLPFILKGQPRMRHRRIIVRQEITLRTDARHQTANLLDQITERSPGTLRVLKEAFDEHRKSLLMQQEIVIVIEYTITKEELKRFGNEMYHGGLDMWITTKQNLGEVSHPYSEEGMMQATIWNNTPVAVEGGGALFAVEIVDNTSIFGDRFMNIAGEVYPVRSKIDSRRMDGVYVTRTEPSEGELGSGEIKVGYYPFRLEDGTERDFTEVHLYRTYAEAKTLGDIAGARKEELSKLDFTLQLSRRDLDALKQQSERERLDYDRERQVWEREKVERDDRIAERERRNKELSLERDRLDHELTMVRMRVKDNYETKSQARKDTSELLKILPGIILGGAALVTTILTLMKKS